MPTDTPVPNAGTPPAIAPYIDAERFTALVEQGSGLALVDFTAAWCPPCRILAPHVDALARELSGSVVVAKVDVDDQPGLASRFSVLSAPTLIFFRRGQAVDRIVGAVPPEHLRARVKELRRSSLILHPGDR
jgi:thioredoxin